MARPSSKDPLNKFLWIVSFNDSSFTRTGFASCDTPGYTITAKSYPEGGQHLFPRQIVDSIAFKPITLTRGVTSSLDFHNWAMQAFQVARGMSRDTGNTQTTFNGATGSFENSSVTSPVSYRKDITIKHLNRRGETVKVYTLYNAFPIEYEVASSFSSDADDTLSMEKLVLVYESFSVDSKEMDSNPLNPRDAVKRLINKI